ncbi:MAG TPA: ABC transporter substrate-binding protein [Elusimicrobiales bacterium]|nr:ABC transporter substrate-binding protein [Elusimicrobiales bacterium]
MLLPLLLASFCFPAAPSAAAAPPLRYWFWWEASTFDTYYGDYFDVMQVARNIYAPLVSIGMDGRPQGMAADDWKVDPSGKIWRFHIRKGLTFEDGAPVTSSAALANFRRMLWLTRGENLPLNSLMPETDGWKDYAAPLKCLYTEGEELVFKFKRRPDNLFEVLSHPLYGIASPLCFDGEAKWKDKFCSVASGQYRVAGRSPGKIKLVSRHALPAAKDAPEEVEILTPLKPGESALKAMFAGAGEMAIEPGFALSSGTLKAVLDHGFELTEEPPSRMYFVQLNHEKPPFTDKVLRRSVRDVFLSLFLKECLKHGIAPVEPSFMPRGGVGYGIFPVREAPKPAVIAHSSVDVVFFPLANYPFPADGLMQEIAENTFLKTLELHGLKPVVTRHLARKGAMQRFIQGDYNVIMRGSGITINDPYAGLKMMFLSKISARIPDPSGRASGFIRRANETADPAERRALIGKMNEAVFEDAAAITFAHSSWVYIHKPGVDMSHFNLFMDPIEFRAIRWTPQKEIDHAGK